MWQNQLTKGLHRKGVAGHTLCPRCHAAWLGDGGHPKERTLSLQCHSLTPNLAMGETPLWLFLPWRRNSLLSEPLRSLGYVFTQYTGCAPH